MESFRRQTKRETKNGWKMNRKSSQRKPYPLILTPNRMKALFFHIIILFSTCVYATSPQQPINSIDKVVIKIAPWDIMTDVNVGCDNYETYIDYKVCTVKNSCMISKLLNELSLLSISQKGGEDIRCKLIFYHAGEISRSVCVGKILTKIESDYYDTSPQLIATINSIVNSPQSKRNERRNWIRGTVRDLLEFLGRL